MGRKGGSVTKRAQRSRRGGRRGRSGTKRGGTARSRVAHHHTRKVHSRRHTAPKHHTARHSTVKPHTQKINAPKVRPAKYPKAYSKSMIGIPPGGTKVGRTIATVVSKSPYGGTAGTIVAGGIGGYCCSQNSVLGSTASNVGNTIASWFS